MVNTKEIGSFIAAWREEFISCFSCLLISQLPAAGKLCWRVLTLRSESR